MGQSLVPEWIKRMDAGDRLLKAQAGIKRQQEYAASLRVATGAHQFFNEVVMKCSLAAACLRERAFNASVCVLGDPSHEQGAHIIIGHMAVVPKLTTTNVFYKKDHSYIRVLPLGQDPFELHFGVDQEAELSVWAPHSTGPMDPKAVAGFIMGQMVKLVRESM